MSEQEFASDPRQMTCNVDELSGWLDSWLDAIGRPELSSIEELESYARSLPVDQRPTLPPRQDGAA